MTLSFYSGYIKRLLILFSVLSAIIILLTPFSSLLTNHNHSAYSAYQLDVGATNYSPNSFIESEDSNECFTASTTTVGVAVPLSCSLTPAVSSSKIITSCFNLLETDLPPPCKG